MTMINTSNYSTPALPEEESSTAPKLPQEQIDEVMKATFAANAYAEWLKEVLTSDGTNPDEKYEW